MRASEELTVNDVLAMELLANSTVLAGKDGLDRRVERLNVMTVPDILPWTKEHEFMLSTGYPLPETEDELRELVTRFDERGVAALGIKFGPYAAPLPQCVLDTADALNLPLVEIPDDVAFDDILSRVFSDIVNRQAATIARAQQIHDAFLHIVLTGGQLPEIAAKLAELLHGAAVLVADGSGRLLATVHGDEQYERMVATGVLDERHRLRPLRPGTHELDGKLAAIVSPICAGALRHGNLVAVENAERMGSEASVAVDQAALVAALDVTRQLAVAAVERQFESNVLHDLVTGTGADVDDVVARGTAFGWNLDRRLVVVVSRPPESANAPGQQHLVQQRYIDAWRSEIRAGDRHAAAAGFATDLVAVLGAGENPAELVRGVTARLKTATHRDFSIGISRPFDDRHRIPGAYQEACTALTMGRRVNGPGKITAFDDLGLFRLLSLVDDVAELRRFVDDTLGELLRLDAKQRDDLLHTLRVLLDKHLNVAEAARTLHFHYNTVRYRVTTLERLVGPFTSDGSLCLRLSVALQVLEMHEVAQV
ncbi:MAG: PucR family transcriptional regulator [Pseudonocardiaceae bacterium]|nr:PucR family transcriptional regulator [Pseudonocardiaceae bacterium]